MEAAETFQQPQQGHALLLYMFSSWLLPSQNPEGRRLAYLALSTKEAGTL